MGGLGLGNESVSGTLRVGTRCGSTWSGGPPPYSREMHTLQTKSSVYSV